MFVEVNIEGADGKTPINLDYAVKAKYERRTETQYNVSVALADGTIIQAEDREGKALYDALMSLAAPKGGVQRVGAVTTGKGKANL